MYSIPIRLCALRHFLCIAQRFHSIARREVLCAALQNDMEFLCLFFDFLGARLRSRQKDERYPKGSGNAMDVFQKKKEASAVQYVKTYTHTHTRTLYKKDKEKYHTQK